MTDPDASALFGQLIAESTALSGPVAAWLQTGYREWQNGQALDAALKLRPKPGQRTAATKARLHRRNGHLRKAWAVVGGESDWAKSRNLADAIARLPIIYRRYKAGHAPITSLNHALCLARDCGRLPEKPRQLLTICVSKSVINT